MKLNIKIYLKFLKYLTNFIIFLFDCFKIIIWFTSSLLNRHMIFLFIIFCLLFHFFHKNLRLRNRLNFILTTIFVFFFLIFIILFIISSPFSLILYLWFFLCIFGPYICSSNLLFFLFFPIFFLLIFLLFLVKYYFLFSFEYIDQVCSQHMLV